MVAIPRGTFVMGDDASARADERPAHRVTLAAFRAATAPVTNAEYARFVSATRHEPPPFLHDERFNAPGQPVVGVNWPDAVAYCEWLSRETGISFRLPTEAERERAARGIDASGDWPWAGALEAHPRYDELAVFDRPHPPDEQCANSFGLWCMGDNVHEWCTDWYDAHYYAASPSHDPHGPAGPGRRRASRGGSWRHQIKFARAAARSSIPPGLHYNDYGFRVYADA
jgi:formylglycine-generating enzyme required for sulfatase activity